MEIKKSIIPIEADCEYCESNSVDGCMFGLKPGVDWVGDRANIILSGQT